MADPFVAELRLVGFNFAPVGWALASGQVLPISQYAGLFFLLGTNFGGNGTSTFALPNLQGSIPVGAGQGPGLSLYTVGESGGSQDVTLLQSEMPQHSHKMLVDSSPATANTPVNNAFGRSTSAAGNLYTTKTSPTVPMNPGIVTSFGGSLPHNNLMPNLTLNWIIALQGVLPTRP
jgi:microcystin-dependent protein